MLALVDCNSCYASTEAIFRPDLRDKPIVVLSNNDGCIVARNSYAKALQIPDLEPYFKVKGLLDKHKVAVFSSNYELYGDISSRIMNLLSRFSNDMEIYSIDEAFLDLSGHSHLVEYAHKIKNEVWRQQRMPVCVGVGQTKTLAKLANHIAKKSTKLNGVCLIDELKPWEPVFSKIAVSKVWGVGIRMSKRLALLRVHTVLDLMRQPPKLIRKEFGVTIERTVRELNGERCLDLETQPPAKKEIISSRAFGTKVSEIELLKQSVAHHAVRVSEKLRRQKGLARRVYVLVQTSRFTERRYQNSASRQLPYPTNDSRIIVQVSLELTKHLYRSGYLYAKAGVGLFDISTDEQLQTDLFEPGQSEVSHNLMSVMDIVNRRFGSGKVFIGAQGTDRKWSMSRKLKSPAYTTMFSDIPKIRL